MDLKLQSGFLVTAAVSGTGLGAFMTFSGGEVSNDAQDDRPDGINPVSIPGAVSYANVTIGRTFDADRDTADLISLLDRWAKINASAIIGRQPRDGDGNPKGKARTYAGTLVRCKGPDVDANSNTKATLELEFKITGVA